MSSAPRGLAPREGLECLLVKMGRTGLLAEPRRGPQAGKSGDPRSQNADSAKEASAGEESRGIRQRFPYRCNKTKTSRTAGWRSSWSPGRRHHQSLWQAKTKFCQDSLY